MQGTVYLDWVGDKGTCYVLVKHPIDDSVNLDNLQTIQKLRQMYPHTVINFAEKYKIPRPVLAKEKVHTKRHTKLFPMINHICIHVLPFITRDKSWSWNRGVIYIQVGPGVIV